MIDESDIISTPGSIVKISFTTTGETYKESWARKIFMHGGNIEIY